MDEPGAGFGVEIQRVMMKPFSDSSAEGTGNVMPDMYPSKFDETVAR